MKQKTSLRITGDDAVRDVLERHPALRAILADAGLDLCCGGAHPIAFAARAHGIILKPLLAELNAALAAENKK